MEEASRTRTDMMHPATAPTSHDRGVDTATLISEHVVFAGTTSPGVLLTRGVGRWKYVSSLSLSEGFRGDAGWGSTAGEYAAFCQDAEEMEVKASSAAAEVQKKKGCSFA